MVSIAPVMESYSNRVFRPTLLRQGRNNVPAPDGGQPRAAGRLHFARPAARQKTSAASGTWSSAELKMQAKLF